MADLENLPIGSGSLSVLTNTNGGIIDDCIVTRTGSQDFYIVSNAGRADTDHGHLKVSEQVEQWPCTYGARFGKRQC